MTTVRLPAAALPFLKQAVYGLSQGGYAGASQFNKEIGAWRPPIRSADAEVLRDRAQVAARARDLVRNNAYAKQAVRVSRLGVVGKSLRLSLRPDYRYLGIDPTESARWAREFERVWEQYAHGPEHRIDAGRRLTFTQMMGLLHDTDFIEGDGILGVEWRENSSGWKTCFQVIDPDRLSNPHGHPDSIYLRAGVELDEYQAPIAYHIREAHPGDIGVLGARTMSWQTIPRETEWGRPVMIHVYDAQRPGQTRGISEFSSIIRAMRMTQEFAETELAAAVLQASYAAVIETAANYSDAQGLIDVELDENGQPASNPIIDQAMAQLASAAQYHQEAQITFNGIKIPHLVPGEKLHLTSPGQKATSYVEFSKHKIKEFAAGLATDPILVSQNYSDVNYSSARMSVANNWRHNELRRTRVVNGPGLKMVGAFMEEVLHSRALPMPKGLKESDIYDALPALARGVFIAAGPPLLDPTKERQAQKMGMEIGVDTLQSIAAEDGEDWEELLDQLAIEQNARAARGLPPLNPLLAPPASGSPPEKTGDEAPDKTDAAAEAAARGWIM